MFNLFNNKHGEYFLISDKKLLCEVCNKPLNEFVILKQYYYTQKGKAQFKNFTFCSNTCGKQHIFISTHSKVFLCYIADFVEGDFVSVFPNLHLKEGKGETVFSAATLESEKTVDKAIISRTAPSLEGATIGKDPELLQEQEQERLEQVERKLLK